MFDKRYVDAIEDKLIQALVRCDELEVYVEQLEQENRALYDQYLRKKPSRRPFITVRVDRTHYE